MADERTAWERVRCFIGWHWWKKEEKGDPAFAAFPGPGFAHYEATRSCEKCEKKQKWLPGYGGSELGCWLDIRE